MKKIRRLLSLALSVALVLSMVLPARAEEDNRQAQEAEAIADETIYPESGGRAALAQQKPTKEAIAAKWKQVTAATSLYEEKPSISAPYKAGKLTDNFLESGLTYFNYIRFVAGLPEVTMDAVLNEDAQHGAVLLAANNVLSHTPASPADMDTAFYKRGYGATSTSNISARKGYAALTCIQNSIQGCLDDSGDNNLSTLGHRRWILNPTLGKVGFGYAESRTGWSFIVTPVFDRTGPGCDYDFISWPMAGNQPTNLFNIKNPWSITLNPKVYKTPSASTVKITITRQSDGKQWSFDSKTGNPSTHTNAYMLVNNQGYGVNNCIIFHPGSNNVSAYSGVFEVKVTGIYYINGTAAELNYEVDFFDVNSVCTDHTYQSVVTQPTCKNQGFTTYTCTKCGYSCEGDYVAPVDHVYEDGECKWCGYSEGFVKWYSGTTSLNGTIDLNIYMLLSEDLVKADDTYVRFTYAGKTVDVPMADALHSPLETAPNRYRFSCPVYAKQLADTVNVKFMKGDRMIGTELNYSVMQYCVNQIKKCKVPEEVAVYKAMLNYGAASQQLFGYNTENLANASLNEADKVLANVDASAYKYSVSGSESGIKAKSATLMLEDVVKVRVYFTLTGDKSIEDYTFTIDGEVATPSQNDKGYYVETDGIAAKDLEKMFEVQVGGITVTYGALSYVNSKVGGSNVLESNISKALYAYWQAAEALLG